MTPVTQKKPSQSGSANKGINPFARALAEAEKFSTDPNQSAGQQKQSETGLNPFSDALARTGGNFANDTQVDQARWQEEQRKKAEVQQKKNILRKKLHDQVNPVDMRAVYDAREKEVAREINSLRHELKLLVKDVAQFEKQIEIAVVQNVVNPGQTGKYYLSFFRNLRAFILLLRQKIKSARTWSTQFNVKQKKKKQGLHISGKSHEQTKTVFDMMHHERSTVYSGS